MGSVLSSASTGERNVENVTTSESETMNDTDAFRDDDKKENCAENAEETKEHEDRAKAKEEEMIEFRRQLTLKREQRKEILARHRAEKEMLEKSLQTERTSKYELYESNRLLRELLLENNIEIPENLQSSKENSELSEALINIREEFETLKSNNNKLRKDLTEASCALQEAYSDIADLNAQNRESMKQINALKEVVTVSKTMINLREQQLNDLKNKLNEIDRTLADRETNLLSADLRQEYERQLQNIRTLRGLYEERARLAEVSRQGLVRDLDEHKILYQAEVKKCKDLKTNVEELEEKIDSLLETIENKNLQISSFQDETNGLKAEMAVVNKLFSQVLLGYKTKQDLDKLVHRLEENHGLLTHMAERENGSESSSALPKLLLELVSQVEENERKNEEPNTAAGTVTQENELSEKEDGNQNTPTTAEEIVENLPKVWKVLIELLSHQNVSEENTSEKVTTCYKSVETKSGPVLVPSVSQTYIRLKDLIVEKLGLIKEVNRMKQLNAHLETRLEEQERRLCLVTTELSKTWHVVGRLRRHHHQLHTHEKILKYELQQKRKLLNELKEELEYCREKWEQAREKNTQSEKDWRKLRAEFSSRKTKSGSPSFNNSGESGYSDERPSDDSSESNDESEYVAEPLIKCKKVMKKSFETILDSSTDFNLAAEREDPASDMLDVADLPLDTQESEENRDAVSEASKSEHIYKSGKLCEETEDEIGDITHDDSCAEESPIEQKECILEKKNNSQTNLAPTELSNNDHVPLLKTLASIKLHERVDHLINEPTTSHGDAVDKNSNELVEGELLPQSNKINGSIQPAIEKQDSKTIAEHEPLHNQKSVDDNENKEDKAESTLVTSSNSVKESTTQSDLCTPDFKAILENVKKQNERLVKKDERLKQLEDSCSEVVQNIASTLSTGDEIIEKLDTLHNEHQSHEPNPDQDTNEDNSREDTESIPSTSNEIDHEARFAARDLRLKRLEEQTKSLVNKVNKTTSKGVKIHYKLEELHNIYGSENSRAGTPSEDNEEKNNENHSSDE